MNDHPTTPRFSPESDVTRLAASTAAPSQFVGPYRLLQALGEGGMGEVWLAEQLHPVRRHVAVKIIKAGMDTAQVVARFEAERQALALMEHSTIAKVFDGGSTAEGRAYFAMEYVRGEPLTTYCDRHRLSVRQRLELFIELCEGVQHAHQKGIIHRDLKPSNVLVTVQGDRPVPRIIDFGVAKAVAQPLTERSLFTEVGMFIGTPEYMSPEQADMTSLDVDTRSDVYSLGVILYELLVGTVPFDWDALRKAGIDEIRRTIREKDPPRPSTVIVQRGATPDRAAEHRATQPARLASLLRGDLDWITMRALEKDRTRRYPTANALAIDIRHHLVNEPVLAGPPTASYRMRKFARRHRMGVAAAGVLVALLTVFAAVMTVQSRRIAQERDRANQEAATAKQVSEFLVGLFKASDPTQARGDLVTAREILDRGAREIEQTLRDQPDVQGRLQSTIGEVYTSLGSYDAALPLLEKAAATQRRVLGDDHPDTLVARHLLANLYWTQGRFGDAEPLYLDLVQRRTRLLGEQHPQTLKVNFDLASLYARQQKWTEAEALQHRTLEMQQKVLGPDHFDTIASQGNLVAILHGQRRYVDALPMAIDVATAKRRTLGDDHPSTLVSMHNLAFNYEFVDQFEQAEPLYLDTISKRRRILGESHPSTAGSRVALARMYEKQRRYGESEPLALSAYEAYLRALGASHTNTQGTIRLLVRLYDGWGKAGQASEWRAKLPKETGG
jgi:non-specific serine/threonine protein kinase/serine/threonine-protein kinase